MFRIEKSGSTAAAFNTLCDFATSRWRQQNKVILVEDGDDHEYEECCYKLFTVLNSIKVCDHAVMDILTDLLELFHHEYGCSTRTLLLMCRVWYNTLQSLSHSGLTATEITESLKQTLSESDKLIDKLSQSFENLFKTRSSALRYSRHSSEDSFHPSLLKLSEAVCRGDKLINECVYNALIRFEDFNCINCEHIHVMGVCGPNRDKTAVVDGLVLGVEESQKNLLKRRNLFKCVLLIGDLTKTYRHTGYKPVVKHRTVISSYNSELPPCEDDWTEIVLNIVEQIGVNAIVIKGACDSSLKLNLIKNGIVVFDHVPSSLLKILSRQTHTILHHHINDIQVGITSTHERTTLNVKNVLELELSVLNMKIKRGETLVSVKTPDDISCTSVTILICSSSPVEVRLLEERIQHALSRLHWLFKTDNYVRENIEEKLYQHFTQLSALEANPARSTAYQHFSNELAKYTQPACDTILQQYDCSIIKKESMRLGLEAASYCSKLDITVKTGIDKDDISQYDILI